MLAERLVDLPFGYVYSVACGVALVLLQDSGTPWLDALIAMPFAGFALLLLALPVVFVAGLIVIVVTWCLEWLRARR